MAVKQAFIMLMTFWLVSGQRPSFAGSKPIGFPDIVKPVDPLGNRFGEETHLELPMEARGDRDLIERIRKMPVDQQPFWYINWKALEQNRNNPLTYEQRPNSFSDQGALSSNQNLPDSNLNSRFGNEQNVNNQNSQDSYTNFDQKYTKHYHY